MPTFQKPNLEADTGGLGREPYLSVRSDGASLGLSRGARENYDVETGTYVHLAFDQSRRPWVAFLGEPTNQGEPQVREDGRGGDGRVINSTLLNRHLREVAEVGRELESSLQFHFTGETAEDPETGATLHRLEIPEV